MTFLTNNDVRRLAAELAVANSAGYILRRFGEDPVVRGLGLRSPNDLLAVVRHADQQPEPTLEQEVQGYAAAVALVISGAHAVLEAYALTQVGGLVYLPELVALSRSTGTQVNVQKMATNDYRVSLSPGITVSTSSAESKRSVGSPANTPEPLHCD